MEVTKVKDKDSDLLIKVMGWTAFGLGLVFLSTFFIYFIIDPLYSLSDFAETIAYCITKNPYDGSSGIYSIYPPFAFLPFYLFALICKQPLSLYVAGEMSLPELCKQPSYILSFFLFFAICYGLILFLSYKITKFKGKKLVMLLIIVSTIAPMLFCFLRANNIIFAVVFSMLFFWLHNSEKRWHREIANLCLACAISVKIYPIVLVLFFIKDRRFLDMLKTILYSLVLLFIPFLLVDGGFGNIKHIWSNFTSFNSGGGRNNHWNNISFDSLASKISNFFALIFSCDTAGFYSILSKILRYGMLITTIVVFALAKKSDKRMQTTMLAILTYELFMGVSYAYTLLFLVTPILYYFMDFDKLSNTNKIYYGVCLAVICFPLNASTKFFFVAQFALAALLVKCYIDLIKEFQAKRTLKLAAGEGQPVSEVAENTELNKAETETVETTKEENTKQQTKVEGSAKAAKPRATQKKNNKTKTNTTSKNKKEK